jgi:drug/metabolite transporter (DMT)-like permease
MSQVQAHRVARRGYLLGLALAIVGAVFFSGKAIIGKLLYVEGIDALELVALRMLLSAPFFALVGLWAWSQRPRPTAADALRIAVLGLLGYYAASLLDFMGLQYITAGLERLILFLTPSIVLLLGMTFFGRRVSGLQWLSMAFAYAGIALVVQHDLSIGGDGVALGAGLVFGAAVSYGLYLLLSGEIVQRVGTLRLVSLAMIACAVATITHYALARPLPGLFEQSAAVWQLSGINAVLCTVLPVFLIMSAIARIGAGVTAQAGMMGPVSTLALAWWILDEPVSGVQLAGTALVLAGILLLSAQRAS